MLAFREQGIRLIVRGYNTKLTTVEAGKLVTNTQKADRNDVLNSLRNELNINKSLAKDRVSSANKTDLASQLFEKYNPGYINVPRSKLGSVNHFFNTARVTYEWSASEFMEIPGERLKKDYETRALAETTEFPNSISAPPECKKRFPGKTDGIPFELLNGLPEVVFLGRCNAGKSTLLNNITTEYSTVKLQESAKTSKKAGFTKTINCYNVGRRFRLVDTPGYGVKGTYDQGELIMQYLRERRELRRTYLLISAEQGFSTSDCQIVDFLTKFGIPFEIIFTKLDKVRDLDKLHLVVQESGVLELPTLPQMLFLNSTTNSKFPKRLGIDRLRSSILEGCGLQSDVKPMKVK
ncbi:LANO_0B05094g1_1 [Lachancea nothofagi CBS 11611]|uniref:LANO_0B05094g1_1 n=1 Tax=Lachancea nothofagi CBS 11611 TaxID=1266666 RepID=A0A1G4IYR1_9SACH|nr:LANO_0B05094g1_1 [Lachancea nothofagi CBS 11611]